MQTVFLGKSNGWFIVPAAAQIHSPAECNFSTGASAEPTEITADEFVARTPNSISTIHCEILGSGTVATGYK